MAVAPTFGGFRIPDIQNEVMRNYEPKSSDRANLQAAVDDMLAKMPFEVPCLVDGQEVKTGKMAAQINPADHSGKPLCNYHEADPALVQKAIDGALKAKQAWSDMPWNDRAAIFLKAADLIAHKYRFQLLAATMLGQGKNVWQAEIDAAAESCDFLRFGVQYVEQLYNTQPGKHSPMVWNRSEYRPLEGFVLAVSPFNFTAIGANLVGAPAMVINVVVWKPSPMAIYSNYMIWKIFKEAGMPEVSSNSFQDPQSPLSAQRSPRENSPACISQAPLSSSASCGSRSQ